MNFNVSEFSQLSIQAKISFVEWLGQKLLPKLQGKIYKAALDGLALIDKWRKDQTVDGDALSLALMNEEEEGIYAYENNQNSAEANSAIEIIGGVASYVAWRA